jgi:hypothetical protein
MASANLDLVRSIHAAWERGDFSSTEWAHPEIEYVAPDGPEPSSGTGMLGLAKAWRDFLGAWGDYRAVAEQYRELDGERVLVLLHATARGKASGLCGSHRATLQARRSFGFGGGCCTKPSSRSWAALAVTAVEGAGSAEAEQSAPWSSDDLRVFRPHP